MSSLRPHLPRLHHSAFDADELARSKRDQRLTVSVCLPARDEEATVGQIVEAVRADLVDRVGLVDEIVVVDDHSSDRTAERALAAGAKVVDAATVRPDVAGGPGKGQALWRSVAASTGDLLVWCDADIVGFGSHVVTGLVGPLLTDPATAFVKGFYRRPVDERGRGGGRVTELVARPALSLLFPELVEVVQPLAGEYASRRTVVERLPFVGGYGVDLGLLVDVARVHGTSAVVQVDLDERVDRAARVDRNRSLDELSSQALAVLQTALRRAGSDLAGARATLRRPDGDAVVVDVSELPPLVDVADDRAG